MNQTWEEIQDQFKETESYLASKRLELIQKIIRIFEINESSGLRPEGFNWHGNDELLKLNFGGRNVDIKRSVLTRPKFGWNLFSRLFEKRWDAFHVRDKNGRIYVDLKEEWMRPLIDYMKYNGTGTGPISSSNIFLYLSIHLFNEAEEFKFPALDFSIVDYFPSGIDVRVFPSQIRACTLQNSYWEDHCLLKPHEVSFQFIYSTDFDGTPIPPAPTDMRFKTLAYIVSIEDFTDLTYILYLRVGKSSIHAYDYKTGAYVHFLPPKQKNISTNLLSIFPLPFSDYQNETGYLCLKTDPNNPSTACFCDKLEVYEVKINYKQIIPTPGLLLEDLALKIHIPKDFG
jgi:hypothetical protein